METTQKIKELKIEAFDLQRKLEHTFYQDATWNKAAALTRLSDIETELASLIDTYFIDEVFEDSWDNEEVEPQLWYDESTYEDWTDRLEATLPPEQDRVKMETLYAFGLCDVEKQDECCCDNPVAPKDMTEFYNKVIDESVFEDLFDIKIQYGTETLGNYIEKPLG